MAHSAQYNLTVIIVAVDVIVQFSSVQSLGRARLCNSMNRSTPGLPVHHQLSELLLLD